MESIKSLDDIKDIKVSELEKKLVSANQEDILKGLTTDVYFVRTLDILKHMNLDETEVTAEIFARKEGIFVGIEEVKEILKDKDIELWALDEGEKFKPKDTLVRIKGKYNEFAIYESVILGCLASPSGWATAAY